MLAFHEIAPLESTVLSQPISEVSNSSHLNQVLELLRSLVKNRSSEVRHRLEKVGKAGSVDVAHGRFAPDLSFRALVFDDYFGPAKAAPFRAQVDALVNEGRLVPFGYYGWGTWVGRWRRI